VCCWENCKNNCGKQYGNLLKKLKILPAIPLLSTHPKELKPESPRGIYIPMFIAALFTITKRWK
jgi:hypothetical protein